MSTRKHEQAVLADFYSLLSEKGQYIFDVVGADNAERFFRRFGGLQIYFPAEMEKEKHAMMAIICETIGKGNTQKLCDNFRCEDVYVPREAKAFTALRNARYYSDLCELTAVGVSKNRAIIMLRDNYDMSYRLAWDIISGMQQEGKSLHA